MRVRRTSSGLIGRQPELASLVELIRAGDGAAALIGGEPGIGKSRLVREATHTANVSPMVGTASPASLGRPFDLLLSAVEPVVRWWTTVPTSLSAVEVALGQLLGPVAAALPAGEPTRSLSPADLTGAAIALLRDLEPDVLVLEDIHWADVESLQAIERTLAGPEPPVVICTYRPEELDREHPAAALIRMIERRPENLHLHLESFSAQEVHAYVLAATSDDLDRRTLDHLLKRTGGNPFFLEQIVDGGFIGRPGDEGLPWTLSESIHRQLAALSRDQHELLATAAILGSPFEFDLLANAAGLDEAELIDRLRGTVERGVLVEEDVDLFRFRHELVRDAIVDSLLGRERRRLHERSFVALQSLRPHDYAELARHARGAERFEDLVAVAPQGVRHYLKAGSTFQAYKLATAALAELPGHRELTELAARSGWLAGRHAEARDLAERWLEHARTEDPGNEHAVLELLARIAFETGDDETQAQVIEELEGRIQRSTDEVSQAKMLAVLAQHRMLRHDLEEAVLQADRALEIAERIGLIDVRRRALLEKYSASICLENGQAAVAGLASIAKEAEEANDHLSATRAWYNLLATQPADEAAVSLARMRDAAVRLGADMMAQSSYAEKRASLALLRADMNDARHWAGRARLAGKGTVSLHGMAMTEVFLALESGDMSEAECLLGDDSFADQIGQKKPDGRRPLAEAVIAAVGGRTADALEALGRMSVGDDLPVLLVLAYHDLCAGGVAPAELSELLDRVGTPGCDTVFEIALALLNMTDDPVRSREQLSQLVDAPMHSSYHPIYPETNERLLRAETHLALAQLAHDAGDTPDAHAHARAAAEILEKWPGVRRARALALLAKGESADSSGLTGRELDVVRLVARGLTNGQIADELFIARKTVSTHVSHVLAKLDMESRTEVAQWAIDEGIATAA